MPALEDSHDQVIHDQPPDTKPANKSHRRKTFRLAPKPRSEQKEIRAGSKRRTLFDMTSKPEGALFSEMQAACNWSAKDNYEGIRLLHVWCGYGLWSEDEGEDYRIWLHTETSTWRAQADASRKTQSEKKQK